MTVVAAEDAVQELIYADDDRARAAALDSEARTLDGQAAAIAQGWYQARMGAEHKRTLAGALRERAEALSSLDSAEEKENAAAGTLAEANQGVAAVQADLTKAQLAVGAAQDSLAWVRQTGGDATAEIEAETRAAVATRKTASLEKALAEAKESYLHTRSRHRMARDAVEAATRRFDAACKAVESPKEPVLAEVADARLRLELAMTMARAVGRAV